MFAPIRCLLPALTLLAGLLALSAFAAEETKTEGAPEQAASTPVDRYAVPEGDAAALLKFIEDLQAFRPTTSQELTEHRQKMPQALREAAERILALEKDKRSEVYRKAQAIVLTFRVQMLTTSGEEEQRKIVAEVQEYLASQEKPARNDLSLAFTTASRLEQAGNTELAEQAYTTFGNRFKQMPEPSLARMGEKMLGSARRMKLLGNELSLEGKTVDGSTFDWEAYRGKVVLVDFWATWCGPCIAELPHVKRTYELYRDKGFDVVGISLDTDREKLETFLKEQELPWANLFEEGAGWDHPLATYYGVMAIPTVMLVDQQGKVVNMNARGQQLTHDLARLLGPVEEDLQKLDEPRQPAGKPN